MSLDEWAQYGPKIMAEKNKGTTPKHIITKFQKQSSCQHQYWKTEEHSVRLSQYRGNVIYNQDFSVDKLWNRYKVRLKTSLDV